TPARQERRGERKREAQPDGMTDLKARVTARFTVRDLLLQKADSLQLESLTGDVGLERGITLPEVSSPGLVLAGFTRRFASKRLHALGETEISYLQSLTGDARRQALEKFLSYELPC